MKSINKFTLGLLFSISLWGCQESETYDASGSFEAEETIISSQAGGVLKEFKIEEGDQLDQGQWIGYVDSVQLYLKKLQLESQVVALNGRKPNISLQLAALQEELKAAEKDEKRITGLVKAQAATAKQLDDIKAKVEVIRAQIDAQKSNLDITTTGITNDASPLEIQIAQIEDQIEKSKIINPVQGTVLVKYAEENEMTAVGKPLYKIANLQTIILRVYISGDQLSQVKIGQEVTVHTDNGEGGFDQAKGKVTWINDKAEFTPKTIQTKEERANMVYAMKIEVPNDGKYKIGMYGEVSFD